MSTRASGLANPANGLTASAAISAQRQQDTISASLAPQAVVQQATTAVLGGSQANTLLAPGGSTPLSESTLGLRATLNGATPPPTISSSQDGTSGSNTAAAASATPTPTPGQTPRQACPVSRPPARSSASTPSSRGTTSASSPQVQHQGQRRRHALGAAGPSNRPDVVSEDDLLQIGQKLRIPQYSGVVHTVLSSQTLGEIADRYGVTPESIMAVAANGIGDPNALSIGKELIIPNPTRFATPAPHRRRNPPPPPAAAPAARSGSSGGPRGNVPSGPRSASGLIWPVSGPISSYFGPSHPLGIDIDLFATRTRRSAPRQPVP